MHNPIFLYNFAPSNKNNKPKTNSTMATNIYQVKVTNHYLDAECDEHSRIKRSEFYSKLELAENAYEKYLHSNDDNMYDYPTNEYYDVITITEITLDTNEQKCLKTSGDCICNIP